MQNHNKNLRNQSRVPMHPQQQPMNTGIINPNQMNTGMLNYNQQPQMMPNLNPMNTGSYNFNNQNRMPMPPQQPIISPNMLNKVENIIRHQVNTSNLNMNRNRMQMPPQQQMMNTGIINPNQMNTGMLNYNQQPQMMPNLNPMNTGSYNFNNQNRMPMPPQQQMMNTGIINPNQMNTGMLNYNQQPQMMPNLNPMNTGSYNFNNQNRMPMPPQQQMMNTGIINPNPMNTGMLNYNQQMNNPFYQPNMNTREFNFSNNDFDSTANFQGNPEANYRLEELARLYQNNLISNEEYIIRKREIIMNTLNKL